MSEHLIHYAQYLVRRENGQVELATIVHAFTNLGNPIPGDDPAEQRGYALKLFNAPGSGLKVDGELVVRTRARHEELGLTAYGT